jgi:hypothetical protein
MNENQSAKTSIATLIMAWVIVALPAAWGITTTIQKSMALFHSPPPAMSAVK